MNFLLIFRIIIQFETRISLTELTLQYLVEFQLAGRSRLLSGLYLNQTGAHGLVWRGTIFAMSGQAICWRGREIQTVIKCCGNPVIESNTCTLHNVVQVMSAIKIPYKATGESQFARLQAKKSLAPLRIATFFFPHFQLTQAVILCVSQLCLSSPVPQRLEASHANRQQV